MNLLISALTRLGILKDDLDQHFLRASMVIIFFDGTTCRVNIRSIYGTGPISSRGS